MSDELSGGDRTRLFTLVASFDTAQNMLYPCESCVRGGRSIPGRRVVEVLDRVEVGRGLPKTIRVDRSTEFTSKVLEQWACESVYEARAGLGRYFEFYNARRPHSSPGRTTPDQFLRQTAVRTLSGLIHDTRFHLQNRGALFRRTRPPHSLKGMESNLRDACFKFVTLRETTTRVQKWSSQYIFSWLPRQDSNLRPAD